MFLCRQNKSIQNCERITKPLRNNEKDYVMVKSLTITEKKIKNQLQSYKFKNNIMNEV